MEINSTSSQFINHQIAPRLSPSEEAGAKETSANDKISMSRDALLLTEALRAAQNSPDVREDKVAELKAAIEAGTYNINGQLIADRLAQDETSLFI